MISYEKRILNALLDSYENSLAFTGENKIDRKVSFPFTKRKIPEYFDESSLTYEEIHAKLQQLERQELIGIQWKRGKENHIVERVLLNRSRLLEVYQYLGRAPKARQQEETLELLTRLAKYYASCPVTTGLLQKLQKRIQENKSVKEYIALEEPKRTEDLVKAIAKIEQNQDESFYREFSIRCFSDSKYFESILGTVTKVFREMQPDFDDMETAEILAEYNLYHTPNFVYFKGEGSLQFRDSQICLSDFPEGIGLSGSELKQLQIYKTSKIKRVLTIENLTTFFRWQEEQTLIIYLGGYHNTVRRQLLQIIYKVLPNAKYLHFGDIDCGGFEIFFHLCQKTGIPFQTYHMDVKTLEQYQQYSKELTEADKKRLVRMAKAYKDTEYEEVFDKMLQMGRKLEQECVGIE